MTTYSTTIQNIERKNPFISNLKSAGVDNSVKNFNIKLTLRLYIDFITKPMHIFNFSFHLEYIWAKISRNTKILLISI
jgi:hypothetical protein